VRAHSLASEGGPCCGRPGPSHQGSKHCRSGSLASGGSKAHCACDACY
jgi:hypothetical protein